MPTLEPVYLTFRTGLHVGRRGIDQEVSLVSIPSDTLFAALVATRAVLLPDVKDWVSRFSENPPFRLTSAFPYAGGVRFYPRPSLAPQGIETKCWRKIQYISEAILKRWLENALDESWLPKKQCETPGRGLTLQQGALWLSEEEIPALPQHLRTKTRPDKARQEPLPPQAIQRRSIYAQAAIPRVLVDRITNRSEIYHVGRVSFQPGCGLWFGVEWRGETIRAETIRLLQVLGDSGLGAERSAGYGAFSFTTGEPITWSDPQPGGLMLLLSRYFPKSQAEAQMALSDSAAYELTYVAGRVQSLGLANQRRRGVQLVAEGSLIASEAQGSLVDVKPGVGNYPHPVYRYGLALGLEVKR